LAAGVMAVRTLWLMRRNNTSVDFNKPTTMLVTKGPFRFTRNPLYLALLMFYLGIAILVNSLWFFPFLLLMFFLFNKTARKEESYLEDRFGDTYRKYKNRVRRWL
jgi:protein-S-isoprenylcysteine O-methyltransferase Ste14